MTLISAMFALMTLDIRLVNYLTALSKLISAMIALMTLEIRLVYYFDSTYVTNKCYDCTYDTGDMVSLSLFRLIKFYDCTYATDKGFG